MAQQHTTPQDPHPEQDARELIVQAIRDMQYDTDPRRFPDERRRVNFRMGWEDASIRQRTFAEATLRRLTWHNAGYRLGKVFGDRPEYIDLAYDILVELYTERFAQRESGSWESFSDPVRRKLDRLLERFAGFRADEARYLRDERTYKVQLFEALAKAWRLLYDDPETSKSILLKTMRGEDPDTRASLNNLLGGHGYRSRGHFATYLEHASADEYVSMLEALFDRTESFPVRVRRFRDGIREAYEHLHDLGKFPASIKRAPTIPQSLVGVLLASYDPQTYMLYRATEHGKTAVWLGIEVPTSPEHAYAVYVNMASSMLAYAQHRGAPVEDLLDVHNMMYMMWRYDEFEDLHTARRSPKAAEPRQTDAALPDESVYEFIRRHHFIFPDWLVTTYVLSLATKPFVILSGISGTGKTKLAQLVSDYVGGALGTDRAKAFVAVRPDWTDNSHLLGWYNAISDRYERTQVLDLLMAATDAPDRPHFIVLDEMNIAKVEHYFSDFLSCMESRLVDEDGNVKQEPMRLHNRTDDEESAEDDIPPNIRVPLNVYVTGTVNVDESTYMFSPKVLDRANVIEFNDVFLAGTGFADSNAGETESFETTTAAAGSAPATTVAKGAFVLRPDVTLPGLLQDYKPPTRAQFKQFRDRMPTQYGQLLALHGALAPYNLHFGYRVANELAAFMLNAERYCVPDEHLLPVAFDLQILQKVLPKLHGNAAQLEGPLQDVLDVLPDTCPLSRRKLKRMQSRLQQVGFASFIE